MESSFLNFNFKGNDIDMKQYLDSEKFKNEEVKFHEKKSKLIQLNKALKEDDNHFVVMVKLKNNLSK